MCDYSLFSVDQRLAEEGEDLTLYRFENGALGFAATSDVYKWTAAQNAKAASLWAAIKGRLWLRQAKLPVVRVSPGARLLLSGVPRRVQTSLCVESSELVIFTEVSSRNYSYHDALLLPNGTRVLLQDLPAGIHALVLSMLPDGNEKRTPAEAYAA